MENTNNLGIKPATRTPEETAIIQHTPSGQAVQPNSTMDTRKPVSFQSEVDGCRYVCRVYNFTANTMHYVFEMDVKDINGKLVRAYLLDNGEYCMAYVSDELADVFNVIVNEAEQEHAYLELYTYNKDVEFEFQAWAEGRESKDDVDCPEEPEYEWNDDTRY